MRKGYDNIEYCRFPGHKHLVGYATLSGVWHIYKCTDRTWYAICRAPFPVGGIGAFYAADLAEVSNQLRSR
jgi:hypothetical protein